MQQQDVHKDSANLIQQPNNFSQLNLKQLPQPIDSISSMTGAARGHRGIFSTRGAP